MDLLDALLTFLISEQGDGTASSTFVADQVVGKSVSRADWIDVKAAKLLLTTNPSTIPRRCEFLTSC